MNEHAGNHDFESLLEYLQLTRGFDFTGYKRASLMRRVDKRMQIAGVENYGDYLDYLSPPRGVCLTLQHRPHQRDRFFPRP